MLLLAALLIASSASARMEFTRNVAVSEFPERLREHVARHPIDKGFVDVTKPPYGAKGDGSADDTDAIQNAIDDAFRANLCVFFPEGTYLVSRRIRCVQEQMGRQWSNHKFAHILVGSTRGKRRPVIRARDGLSFDAEKKRNGARKELIFFHYYATKPFKNRFNPKETVGVYRPSVHYSAQFRGIDIDMGNNAEYSAISMEGAQYCSIEDVTISGNFDVGIDGLPGCGGGTVNVRVIGGKVGIRQRQYRPNPTLTGLVCEGQSQFGVQVSMSMGPVVVTGFRIVSPEAPSSDYRAIQTYSAWDRRGTDQSPGALVLTDGSIEVSGDSGTAIHNWDQDVVMDNVFVKAGRVIESGFRDGSKPMALRGDAGKWRRVSRYAFSPKTSDGYVYAGGREHSHGTGANALLSGALEDAGAPPGNLISRHVWSEAGFASWDRGNTVDVAADFGATPEDDRDDDAGAIQRAIDATVTRGGAHYGKTVFIPRGHFHIRGPVTVRNGAKIVGAANTISVIHVAREWKPSKTVYAVDSESDASGRAVLAHFAILGQKPCVSAGLEAQKHVGLMRVRLGETTIRDVQFAREYIREKTDFVYETPTLTFGPGSGGRMYHFADHMSDTGTVGAGYHKILVRKNGRPLRMYQVSIEHIRAGTSAQMALEGARDVRVYGLKHEGANHIARVTNCEGIQLWGGLSNAPCPDYAESLIEIENSPDTLVAVMASYAKSVGKARLKDGDVSLGDDALLTYYENAARR